MFIQADVIGHKNQTIMSYKAMYKNELADAAGVSLKVLNRWLEPHRQQLAALGVGKYDKMLPPSAVHYICSTFDIEL